MSTPQSAATGSSTEATPIDLPFVTIIMPIQNEREHIKASIDSALAIDYPLDCFELLAVDGMSDDGTRDILAALAAGNRLLRVIDNPERRQAHALNRAIGLARGKVIVRMDAHAIYPADYVKRSVSTLMDTGADNVGGVCVTTPGADTTTARAIACALSHPFGVGNARFRIGAEGRQWVDTVPFGCWRKDTLTRLGGFAVDLPYAEDDELNGRLRRLGGRILLDPAICAQYVARATMPQLALMLYHYGHDKPLAAGRVGRITTARQLASPIFVLALGASSAISMVVLSTWPLVIGLLAAHIATGLAIGLSEARSGGLAVALRLPLVFIIMHVAYGVGYLHGAAKLLLHKRASGLN